MNKFGIHSRPAIDDICSDIEAMDRSVLHDKIVFALAVDKTEAPKPSFLKLEFLAKDQVIPDSVEYDYGYYLLLRKSIFYEDFRDILLKIRDEEAIGIFPIENCVLKIDGWDKRWIPSNRGALYSPNSQRCITREALINKFLVAYSKTTWRETIIHHTPPQTKP